MINKKTVKTAFITSLPVMAGYIVLGTGFGVLLASKGYSFWWAPLMSVTMYAGAMQYVGVSILAEGASLISAALMTLMVNARHLFYGISMVESYREMGWKKWYAAFGLTDETYSLLSTDPPLPAGADRRDFNFLVTLMNQCYWIIGGMIGAALGNALSFNSAGIDFSMTALFVSILVEQWEKKQNRLPAVTGFAISVVCLFIFGADGFLIPAMLCICAALFLIRPAIEKGADKND